MAVSGTPPPPGANPGRCSRASTLASTSPCTEARPSTGRDEPPAIRFLVLDVDGTVLTSTKEFLPEVQEAIRDAASSGLAVSFATGRMYEAVADWVLETGLHTPQICNNGANVVLPATGERLLNVTLSPETVAGLIRLGHREGFAVVLFSGPRVLSSRRTDDLWLLERNNEPVEIVQPGVLSSEGLPVDKMLFLDRWRPARVQAMRRSLLAGETEVDGATVSAEVSEPGILNLCHPHATKLDALHWLCRLLCCSLREVAAVGDGDNDEEVLGAVGLGIAMGNASPRAKAAASVTVPDNDDGGVVVAIRDIVLPRARHSPS